MYLAFFIKGADASIKDSLGTYKVSDKKSIISSGHKVHNLCSVKCIF